MAEIFEAEVVPLLQASPGLRPIALLEEMVRRHPGLDAGVRRTLERRTSDLGGHCTVRSPDPDPDRVVRWRLTDLAAWIQFSFGVSLDESSVGRAVKTLGFGQALGASPALCSGPGRADRV